MKEKIKIVIIFIIAMIISVIISTCSFIKIRSNKEISYMDKKELKSTSDPDYISGIYSSSNTLASNIATLKTSKQNVLKSTEGTVSVSGGYGIVDLGSTYNAFSCFGYVSTNAAVPVICGIQSGRYIRLSTAHNSGYLNTNVWYQVWYYN